MAKAKKKAKKKAAKKKTAKKRARAKRPAKSTTCRPLPLAAGDIIPGMRLYKTGDTVKKVVTRSKMRGKKRIAVTMVTTERGAFAFPANRRVQVVTCS